MFFDASVNWLPFLFDMPNVEPKWFEEQWLLILIYEDNYICENTLMYLSLCVAPFSSLDRKILAMDAYCYHTVDIDDQLSSRQHIWSKNQSQYFSSSFGYKLKNLCVF
jgi:hypothetical protein